MEEIMALVQRLGEAYDNQDWDAYRELVAPDMAIHQPQVIEAQGRDAYMDFIRKSQAAFPDQQGTFEDFIATEDRVVLRWTLQATHSAEWLGIPATGRRIEDKAVAIYRFADGKLAEEWIYSDTLGLLKQLGALPS